MRQKPYIHLWSAEAGGQWDGVFAIRLMACPTERKEGMRSDEVTAQRLQEQVDFINALFCPEPPRAFAMRYIAQPHPTSFSAGSIEVALLGKVSADTKEEAERQAQALCREVAALLGGTMPNYVWDIVTDKATFNKIWEPFDWEQAHIAEIRRREDRVRLESVRPRPVLGRGRAQQPAWGAEETVYFVHPFAPRPTTLARLLRTMLLQSAPILLQASISPVWLSEEEEEGLVAEISKCEQYGQRREALVREGIVTAQTVQEVRAAALCEGLLCQLLRLQDAPFLLNITLASPEPLPRTVVEAVGVEVTTPVGSESVSPSPRGLQAGGYDIVSPQTEQEKRRARQNAQFIAFELWGETLAPTPLRRARWLVDAWEAVGAFRFPIATAEGLMGIEVQTSRFRPLPREVAALGQSESEAERLLVGENRYLGMSEQVFLTERDRRQHIYIVGQTGTGKTTLLKTMIVADMKAGKGLTVIDPHGDLFDELLTHIPKSRIDDVVILDPTDMEFPVGLNMLECPNEEQRHFVVREMRAIMERLIRDQYEHEAAEYAGPAFYQHMQMNMLLTMSNPDDPGTLLEFYEIFQHDEYWKRWLPLRWKEPQLERWTKQNLPNIDYTMRYNEITWGEYLSSKFDDFVFDSKLRLIFGQKRSTIDLRRIMDEGKILLVNLAKGELAEANSRFLGMVLMAKMMAAAMSRTELPVEERRVFYLYVDEFQSLATQSFILLLSEARKFGLGLVLANQFVSQIKDERIVQAIFGNVGTLISFRVGQADAQLLEPHFAPFFDNFDLSNLPNWHACVKTTVNGQVVTPFTLRTILLDEPPDPQIARQARVQSRARYSRPRKEVEEQIRRSLEYKEG